MNTAQAGFRTVSQKQAPQAGIFLFHQGARGWIVHVSTSPTHGACLGDHMTEEEACDMALKARAETYPRLSIYHLTF